MNDAVKNNDKDNYTVSLTCLALSVSSFALSCNVVKIAGIQLLEPYATIFISIATVLGILFALFALFAFPPIQHVARFFRKSKTFDKYFVLKGVVIKGEVKINYVVFQLGLRPKIPLIDLLYLEYLHKLLQDNTINEVFLFPTVDLSYHTQDVGQFQLFKNNIMDIFRNRREGIHIVNPFDMNVKSIDFTSSDYFENIRFMGRKEFTGFVKERLGLKFKGFWDFSRYHPEELRLSSIVGHLMQTWIIYQYLMQRKIFEGESLNIGYLIWETEIEKLGMFVKLSQENRQMMLTSMLGKTLFIKIKVRIFGIPLFFKRKVPIPVFKEEDTFSVFDEIEAIIIFLAKRNEMNTAATNKYVEILNFILAIKFDEEVDLKFASKEGKKLFKQIATLRDQQLKSIKKLTKDAYAALYLVHRLRIKYRLRCDSEVCRTLIPGQIEH